MADRNSAKSQYDDYLRSLGGQPNADTEGDFDNIWGQSSEAGQYSGEGYGKSWDQLFQGFQPTLQARWQQQAPAPAQGSGYAAPQAAPAAAAAAPTNGGWDQLVGQLQGRIQTANTQNDARNTELYDTLKQRSQQALTVDRNDPEVRAQADAYRANETRSARDYISDLAESEGPYGNLRGEKRLASAQVGQRSGANEARLISGVIQARRDEVAQALQSMQGVLSQDEQIGLQQQLSMLDAALKQQSLGLQKEGLDQDWRRALLSNDQFVADLGLRAEDRASYWDAVRRGILT